MIRESRSDVIGFRNVLAHGYDAVEDETVFDSARNNLPALLTKLRTVLDSEGMS